MGQYAGKRFASSSTKNKNVSVVQPIPEKKTGKGVLLRFLCSVFVCILVMLLGVYCIYSYYYGMLNYNTGEFTYSGVFSGDDVVAESEVVSGELGELMNSMQSDMERYDVVSASDVTNILLLGVDNRENSYTDRTDTMILVSICNKTDKIYLTSFMRDMWVYIPDYGYSRLNAANALGGPQLVMKTIEENFKISIDRYAMVNFYTFIDVVNAVGGVEMEVTGEEAYYINQYVDEYGTIEQIDGGISYIPGAGTYRLNGAQALSYCRIRAIGEDFERTNRQRKVIGAIFNEAKGLSVGEISNLAEILFPQVMTNITSMEVLDMCMNVAAYLSYDMVSQRVPADGTWYYFTTSGGAEVVGVNLDANIQMLRSAIYAEE